MKTIVLQQLTEKLLPCVATIGFFDGVHLGHRHIIGKTVATARQEGLLSTLVTFERHPRQVLFPDWHPELLSSLEEKKTLLSETGIDQLVVLRFDRSIAAMSAQTFMQNVLYRPLGVRVLLMGYDNHFGHRETGSNEGFDDYVVYGRDLGITVIQGAPLDVGTVRVSSSKIRHLLLDGDVATAAHCLGRPYQISGVVVGGNHIGTGLGFPTANLRLTVPDKLIPAAGVYAVRVQLDGTKDLLPGMMNIGSRPTFGGYHRTLETNILHFSGNLYGRQLCISFISRLRPEIKFDSRESLISQLSADARRSEEILNRANTNY